MNIYRERLRNMTVSKDVSERIKHQKQELKFQEKRIEDQQKAIKEQQKAIAKLFSDQK